ncbi:MAG: N-acetylmuramoyl-L-alanine amidase family protein [Chthoniobacterales bacterium]|jgi:N-acetylmuramoyl-L-alanine amidase
MTDVVLRRWAAGLLVAVLIISTAGPVLAASAWKIQRLNGRDYLPVRQLGTFYRMQVLPRGDSGVTLVSEGRRMDFVKGSREARIDGVKQWLSFPVFFFAGQFYVSRMDLSKTLDPLMRPQKIPGLKPIHTVVLDPGHGAHDRGAVNRLGSEKNYNLDLTRRIRTYLQKAGLRVVITRSRDEFIPLEQRPARANKLGDGTVFVSVHCNAAGTTTSLATGFEVFTLTPRGAPNSDEPYPPRQSFAAARGHRADYASLTLGTSIYHAMLGRVPMFDRGAKRARFAVLRYSDVPAVLIECGFMTNPNDARKLHNLEWRERLAESVAMGIMEYADLTRTGDRPKLLAQYRAQEQAATAGTEFDYQPLAGIGRMVRSPWDSAAGWRGLLAAPLRDEMPSFHLEYEPPGLVQLEAWAASTEDARASSHQGAPAAESLMEWPEPVAPWPGLRGWRALLPLHGHGREFILFAPPDGAPLDSAGGDGNGGPA